MKGKRLLCLGLVLALTLCGCAKDEAAVYVQRVGDLAAMNAFAPGDRFQGLVVSEDITQVEKDQNMTVAELLVKEGDDVTEGQPLFTYDTQQLQLSLDKQKLELEQLKATIENLKYQIVTLEAERAAASSKLEYTIQIQSTQLDLKEAEINLAAKEDDVKKAEDLLENAAVGSPVTGRIQSISENGYDNYGNPKPYITIQKTGTYRVKGTLGELQRGAIMEGTRMQVISRTDDSQTWVGTVTLVDYESPSQGNQNNAYYYGAMTDEMSSSSKYPFYIELDSTDGLLLGQHVYLQLESQEEIPDLTLSSAFVCYDEDGTTYVWAENSGKLQKRTVTLGEYYMANDGYAVLSGLEEEDYIAFPDFELCYEGAPTTRTEPVMESGVA